MKHLMKRFSQNFRDPDFVQNPYPAYDRARDLGPVVWWDELGMAAGFHHATVRKILSDRRFGRQIPDEKRPTYPEYIADFRQVEDHSLLELEPPRHTGLRRLVLGAFTSRRVTVLEPEIAALCDQLIDRFPTGEFDFLDAFARPLPVTIIARLLGVPEDMSEQLLSWSNAIVRMYMADPPRADQDAANRAAREFDTFLRDYIGRRRADPRDDLLSDLIAAEADGAKLTTDELVSTVILLLNAGHEATVHTLGNALRIALPTPHRDVTDGFVEEILRIDPPLHIFTRWVYEDIDIGGLTLPKHSEIAAVLGAANHDPVVFPDPTTFDPTRHPNPQIGFGAGLHFCVGAPLARSEIKIALDRLFTRCPDLTITAPPIYADSYHFHGLTRLMLKT